MQRYHLYQLGRRVDKPLQNSRARLPSEVSSDYGERFTVATLPGRQGKLPSLQALTTEEV